MKVIIFSDESDEAYGAIKGFKNVEDFQKEIESQLGHKITLSNLRVEKCIMTSRGIPCDLLVPLSTTDVDIDYYYVADVEQCE